jgi:hypothetical protein
MLALLGKSPGRDQRRLPLTGHGRFSGFQISYFAAEDIPFVEDENSLNTGFAGSNGLVHRLLF